DLLPKDIAEELAQLQDNVPPFPGEQAKQIIEASLGEPIDELFSEFSEQALASASIAQVHAATLKNGQRVVVKVLRPDVKRWIKHDLGILFTIARLAERYWSEGHRLRPVEVVEEYRKTLMDELDLMREAANATQLRRNFEGSDMLYVPEVYWEYSRKTVMVMERIEGIPIGDMDALRAAGTDFKEISERGVEIFFSQVFKYNFFHADMHPGNIFVDVSNPLKPKYMAVDFGIMGSLSPSDKRYLAENFMAFFERDYFRVAQLHVDSGWVPEGTRVDEFESAIRTVCEPIFERPLKDISFGQLLLRLFQTARRFDMEVQPQLVLLQKTLLNIEGLGRMLYDELDLWVTAKPFLENWMKDQVGARAMVTQLKQELPQWGEKLPQLPLLAHKVLKQATEGNLRVQLHERDLGQIKQEIRDTSAQRNKTIAGSSILVTSAIVFATGTLSIGWPIGGAVVGGLILIQGLTD
ncbi:MAG: ubiquinone biosynthesis regulatory protein kinase UbiB, partial [Gammaproteobacteria bacterium]|nr:ubiquinone biosynthesis regulatory protein kinase UbiB [Gammaproteobacteria bacterium]